MIDQARTASTTRLEWIDVAKGLSIVLVVFGHVFPPPLGASIAVVRMPFFFFLSGYIFKPRPWPEFLWSRGNSLIVPYFAYLISIVAIEYSVSQWAATGDRFIEQPPLILLRELVKGGSHLDGYVGALWFLSTLFFTLMAFNWLLLRGAGRSGFSPASRYVALPVMTLLAIGFALRSHQIYYGIGIAPVALFFVWAGSAFRVTAVPEWLWAPALLALVAAVVAGLAVYPDYRFDMRLATYGLPVVSLIGSIGGCYVLVLVCKALAHVEGIRAVFSSLGQNSIAIMALHLSVAIPAQRLAQIPAPVTFFLAIILPYLFALLLRQGPRLPQWLFLGLPPRQPAALQAWISTHQRSESVQDDQPGSRASLSRSPMTTVSAPPFESSRN